MAIPAHIAYLRQRAGPVLLLAPAAAAILRDDAGHVLLIHRSDTGAWSLPGGMMEPGERIEDCLLREVREETGLEVEPLRLVGLYSDPAHAHVTYPNGDEVQFVSAAFECRVVGGHPCADGDESLEVAYFAPDALPQALLAAHRVRIEDALAGREAAFVR